MLHFKRLLILQTATLSHKTFHAIVNFSTLFPDFFVQHTLQIQSTELFTMMQMSPSDHDSHQKTLISKLFIKWHMIHLCSLFLNCSAYSWFLTNSISLLSVLSADPEAPCLFLFSPFASTSSSLETHPSCNA